MNWLIIYLVYLLIACSPIRVLAQVQLYVDQGDEIRWAIKRLEQVIATTGETLQQVESVQRLGSSVALGIITSKKQFESLAAHFPAFSYDHLQSEGYAIQWDSSGKRLFVIAGDALGAQYGLQDIADHYKHHGKLDGMTEKINNPYLEYRILKFNLPWSPYRKSEATSVHLETCRDLNFWAQFLDMMAENRFNVLSLWSNHPFPFMVRSHSFPKASAFTDEELADWRQFWTKLFAMAKERGIQTFLVNWNIVVSPSFASAYGAQEYSDLSDQVIAYTKESVRQVIDEYPDLTGIGVTLADWMGNFPDKLTAQQREDWIEKTFVAAMHEASRPVKFLHRSVLAGDPMAMRRLIDNANLPDRALVEIKFNWSHGHSTTDLAITHDYHSGELDSRFWDPPPTNYDIQWMVRNEDFFILRWGQADFIRKHVLSNKLPGVNGYFIGSEGYIPAADYSSLPFAGKDWKYAFEKQWLFYKLWGRLLYDPQSPDELFEQDIEERYGAEIGKPLFEAYNLASNMPLRLASFYRSTWDYTLYSEGFISAEPADPANTSFDRTSPFIAIQDLINHSTLDTSLLSIKDFVKQQQEGLSSDGRVNPLQVADRSEKDSRQALTILRKIQSRLRPTDPTLLSEMNDLAVWSHLGLYFADKLRAATALHLYQQGGEEKKKRQALQYINSCLQHWDQIIQLTKYHYKPVPHVSTENYDETFTLFSWELMRPYVLQDIDWIKKTSYEENR